jgi:hypothetical protein
MRDCTCDVKKRECVSSVRRGIYWLVRERGVGEEERATERGEMSKR